MLNFFKKTSQEDVPPSDWRNLDLIYLGEKITGTCACCGNDSKSVWGQVTSNKEILAAYFIHWTQNHPEYPPSFDLVLGKWGDGTTPSDRQVVAVKYSAIHGGGSFMVVDHPDRKEQFKTLASKFLCRDDVVGKPLSPKVFAILDAVIIKDDRIQEIRTAPPDAKAH